MKKVIIYFASLLIGLAMFSSCEDTNEPILLQDSDKFIAFETTTYSANEEGGQVGILVYIAGVNGTGGNVSFDFDTAGIANPAILGTDFTLVNADQTLSFSNYFGYDTIWIQPIDNDFYDKDKQVNIVLSNPTNEYDLGANYMLSLTIVDNEHPLALVLGTYSVSFNSYFNGAGIVSVDTKPNPDDETQIMFEVGDLFTGWGFIDEDIIYADVDLTDMTIKITSGQAIDSRGYGPSKFTGFDGDNTSYQFEDGEIISGTIAADGTITIVDEIGQQITSGGNEGLWFDIWQANSVWTLSKSGEKVNNYVVLDKTPKAFRNN